MVSRRARLVLPVTMAAGNGMAGGSAAHRAPENRPRRSGTRRGPGLAVVCGAERVQSVRAADERSHRGEPTMRPDGRDRLLETRRSPAGAKAQFTRRPPL